MYWKKPVAIGLVTLAVIAALCIFLSEEKDVDATWIADVSVDKNNKECWARMDVIVTNTGDEPFHVSAEDWNLSTCGRQYAPAMFATLMYGFMETDVMKEQSYSFSIYYSLDMSYNGEECFMVYVGNKNVEWGGK